MTPQHYLTAPEGPALNYLMEDAYSLEHGIYIKEAKAGYAALGVEIKPYMVNAHGSVHGGLIALLADDVTGVASHTLAQASVTMGMTVNYIKAALNCQTLTAIGKIRHGGRRTHVIDFEISDQDQQLIASGTATYFVIEN